MTGRSPADLDLKESFCWLMRSALLDQVKAREKLSMIYFGGERDDNGTVIAADPWFWLAARNPCHDIAQIRSMIEPHMTTEQLNQWKRLFEGWHPRTLPEPKSPSIPLPAAIPNCTSPGNCPAMT